MIKSSGIAISNEYLFYLYPFVFTSVFIFLLRDNLSFYLNHRIVLNKTICHYCYPYNNMDESGLFFCMALTKTISYKSMKSGQKELDKITLILCCNASASNKRTLTIICKSRYPRSFKNFNHKPLLIIVTTPKLG